MAITPGPWQFCRLQGNDGLGYIRPDPEDGDEIAHHGDMDRSPEENIANGHLIAAAPDLLAALRIARSYVVVAIEEFRDEHEARKADEPDRSDGLHAEDAQALAEIEGHLAQIDAAIANAGQERA